MSSIAREDNWLPLLRKFYRMFQETVELSVVFQRVYEMFPSLLGISRASILLYDPALDALVSGDYIGATQPGEKHLRSEPQLIGQSISGLCFLQAKPIVIDDATKSDIIPQQYVEKLGLKSTLAVPIMYSGRPIGVLRVDDCNQTQRFDRELIEWVQLLAEQLAVVIQNARLYSSLNQRDRDLRRVNAELEATRENATTMAQAKSGFLARVSHELRTPLNAILGYAELLREEAETNENIPFASDLRKIETAGADLMNIIRDLLDLSTIEAGKAQVKQDSIELAPILEAAIHRAMPSMTKRGNTIKVVNVDEVRHCYGDPRKLLEVLATIIVHGSRLGTDCVLPLTIRYHDIPGQPVVEMILLQPSIALSAEEIKRLFHTFHEHEMPEDDPDLTSRVGSSNKRLGLTIAQHLCRRMGGNLAAFSDPAHGTAFVIRLPGSEAPVASMNGR